jgi:hypothetical protein
LTKLDKAPFDDEFIKNDDTRESNQKRGRVNWIQRLRHSGMVRKHQTRNLEIPGSMLRIAPE